jgi:hypothetical protein
MVHLCLQTDPSNEMTEIDSYCDERVHARDARHGHADSSAQLDALLPVEHVQASPGNSLTCQTCCPTPSLSPSSVPRASLTCR